MSTNTTITPTDSAAAVRELIAAGAQQGKPQRNPDEHGQSYCLVPAGYSLGVLPAHATAPSHKTLVKLRDASSFIRYVRDHADEASRIYATLDPARFVAVLDDHDNRSPTAAWREFRAEFEIPASREWKVWAAQDRKPLTQKAFSEFLTENLPDVIEPDGATLLEISMNFEASRAGSFISRLRMQDGSHELAYKMDNNAGGTMRLPEKITLSIPVFENESPSLIYARLRTDISGDGKLSLWYELIRAHKAQEQAFRDIWARMEHPEAGAGVPILLGTPE